MTKLRFSDGMEFDTSGPLRKERRSDGLYIVGEGLFEVLAKKFGG